MLPRRHRLTDPRDFRAVIRGGRGRFRAATPLIVVHRADRPGPAGAPARVGFVVSKAVGTAVVRHRVARRLRAVASARIAELPAGCDLVVRANPAAAQALSRELDAAFGDALGRLGVRHTPAVTAVPGAGS